MSSIISGYENVTELYSSPTSFVYRASQSGSGHPVIVKVLREDFPSQEERVNYRQEFEVTRSLQHPAIVEAYSIETVGSTLLMVLEDFGGDSLSILMAEQEALSIESVLNIAIRAAEAISYIHSAGIIHKDLTPHNIVYNKVSGVVKIIDFGISTRLATEATTIRNPNGLEGTLAYMSPEQTGRMNRSLDNRTDFYSFGATIYHLLTGKPPFEETDAMSMTHAHLARAAVPASDLDDNIPVMLSMLIDKLMAKNAEDRYQSAQGLIADLKRCLEAYTDTNSIPTFNLGRKDVSDILKIPEKLFGRERELATLMSVFENVSSGANRLLLVGGYSGVGKTSLVQEVHKPITEKHGYFVSGKFDQFHRNVPYSAIVLAFRDMVGQLLTESEDDLERWRQKLITALGTNAQVIIDVVPEVEVILGPQPAVDTLGSAEAQNRFNLVFRHFIRVFCSEEHPLVLFLDDLQWVDSATLKLIELIVTDPDCRHLLLIGAYRDNEVEASHPLMMLTQQMENDGRRVDQILLAPLKETHVANLLSESLHRDAMIVAPLSTLIMEKTSGNPFFVVTFLMNLYQQQLLTFNTEIRTWQWSLDDIEAMDITDNVVEMLILEMQRLSTETQEVLMLAACVGNRFDLSTLSIVSDLPAGQLFERLLPAINSNLVDAISGYESPDNDESSAPVVINQKFKHDRVHQAAYKLIPESEHGPIHLKIGRLMRADLSAGELDDHIFEVVDHLNLGRNLLDIKEEKRDLAQLNLVAGQKALASMAYDSAVDMFRIALSLLGEERWKEYYELTLELSINLVEAQYLSLDRDEAKTLADEVLIEATDLLDQIQIYELQIKFHVAQAEFVEGIQVAIDSLHRLGFDLPTEQPALDQQVVILKRELDTTISNVKALAELPEMIDEESLAAMRLLMNAAALAFASNTSLWQEIIFTMVKLSRDRGNSPLSSFGYGFCAAIHCGHYHQLDRGYAFGLVSLEVWDQYRPMSIKAPVNHFFNVFVRHWKEPSENSLRPLRDNLQVGLETGFLEFGFYSAIDYGAYLLLTGSRLDFVNEEQKQYLDLMHKLKMEFHLDFGGIWRQATLNLLGQSEDPLTLVGECLDEREKLPQWRADNIVLLSCCAYLNKLMIAYYLRDFSAAYEASIKGEEVISGGTGFIHNRHFNFYQSLTLLARVDSVDSETRKTHLEKIAENQERMAFWAQHCSENSQNKYDLVAAELARIENEPLKAMALYDSAVSGARTQNFNHEQGIACELAGRFYLDLGRLEIANMYLAQAHYAYSIWGSPACLNRFKLEFPYIKSIGDTSAGRLAESDGLSGSVTTTFGNGQNVDLEAVMRASQLIAQEIKITNLLESMMGVVSEHAGAQSGSLVLNRNDKWVRIARWTTSSAEVFSETPEPLEHCSGLSPGICNYVKRTGNSLVIADASSDANFRSDPYILSEKPLSVLCIPLIRQQSLIGLLYLENNLVTDAFTSNHIETLSILSAQMSISLENAELYASLEAKVDERTEKLEKSNRFIVQTFGRYLSDDIVDSLISEEGSLELGGQKRTVTIMMADLRGFAAAVEDLPPERVVEAVNSFLGVMTEIIMKYDGTIDEFLGDSILGVFGAPLSMPDHADRAVACAIEMQLAMKSVNDLNAGRNLPVGEMGIGLHTGEVVVGNIGSEKRTKYGVVGSNVNLCSRIESCSVGGQILLSDATLAACREKLELATTSEVELKGIKEPVQIHDVIGISGRFDIRMPFSHEDMQLLSQPVLAHFTLVDDKRFSDQFLTGHIVRYRSRAVLVKTQTPPPAYTNLRFRLFAANGDEIAGDIYGKVLPSSDSAEEYFLLAFTSPSASVREALFADFIVS